MKIDLHVHTSDRSACGRATEVQRVRGAIDAGLDALAFCDHHALTPQSSIDRLNTDFPRFHVFGGIEVTVAEQEDLIVLGIQDPALESRHWRYADLHRFVREHSGFMALAHPLRYHDDIEVDLEEFPPDAMELRSCNTPSHALPRIQRIATQHHIPLLCNSDAHDTRPLGCYYNVLKAPVNEERELVDILKSGEFGYEYIQPTTA